jgi:type II secretion system protein H
MNLRRDLPTSTEAGMTLTEVLVAVFIMALAAGMVTMTMRPKADPLAEAATRLEHDVASALDLALVTGVPQGLSITEDGYHRVSWQDQAWSPAPGRDVTFPHNVTFDTTRTPTRPESDANVIVPDVVLDTTGTAQGAPLTLLRDRQTITLTIAPNGQVTWEAPDA